MLERHLCCPSRLRPVQNAPGWEDRRVPRNDRKMRRVRLLYLSTPVSSETEESLSVRDAI
jgi:hypothetical protein